VRRKLRSLLGALHKLPPAAPADVESPEAIVSACYACLSGGPGPRPWKRLRSLFAPGAQIIGVPGEPGPSLHLSVSGFARRNRSYFLREPVFERELSRAVERFGRVAQVFSRYEQAMTPGGPATSSGVNCFQLARHDGRWFIVGLLWDSEPAG
jgi:hypothetical protein